MTNHTKHQIGPLTPLHQPLISHSETPPTQEDALIAALERIQSKRPLTLPLERTIKLLHELVSFPLGKFLLEHKGLNGYWTSDLILSTPYTLDRPPLETWIRTKAPVVKATRERFHIFQREVSHFLADNMTLASIPCGIMDCLLRIDYRDYKNISLIGVDLDEESLELALGNAQNMGHDEHLTLILQDAWEITLSGTVDLLISNGLSIYEPDHTRLGELYKKFHTALKPNGILITSFFTPPPIPGNHCPWRNFNVDDILLQKSIISDVVEGKFQNYMTEESISSLLATAGFKVEKVTNDSQCMFPTLVARRVD